MPNQTSQNIGSAPPAKNGPKASILSQDAPTIAAITSIAPSAENAEDHLETSGALARNSLRDMPSKAIGKRPITISNPRERENHSEKIAIFPAIAASASEAASIVVSTKHDADNP